MNRFQPTSISPTRYLFFTGKGGVGKTSIACATAVRLAEAGKKVLIVSTDPASNLDDVFGISLKNHPTEILDVPGLFGANLDPEAAAANYREEMVGQYRGILPDDAIASIEEQLSGACTVEIAAFDEFTKLLADQRVTNEFDHVIFDTAPTGHTLRLLQLPKAWTGFLEENQHGGSCLGPLAGLVYKKDLYAKTVAALAQGDLTTLVLVSRPEKTSLDEAARAAGELRALDINNQVLIINGLFNPQSQDEYSDALHHRQQQALKSIPQNLQQVDHYFVPLVGYNIAGVQGLTAIFENQPPIESSSQELSPGLPGLKALVDELFLKSQGVVMAMGKGGVGKTTVAAAIAIGLAKRGHKVHLTTTDPAAHLTLALGDAQVQALRVSRIDPGAETEAYREEVLASAGKGLDEEGRQLLEEDLASPCTEEIAVFRAFARVVDESDHGFVVLDTAPTGHTLLLLDAAQSYHKEVQRSTGEVPQSVKKLLPRLRDSSLTDVVLVTLPEATPVLEASRLQEDLRRAEIEPRWWVVNQSWQGLDTQEPVLLGRARAEVPWILKVSQDLARQTALINWQPQEPQGLELAKLSQ